MALRYGYFDSDIIGLDDEGMPIFDRAETSDLFALLLASLISDGVLAWPADCFQVVGNGRGMEVEIQPGFGMVKGHFAYSDEKIPLEIGPAPQKYSRIDRIVLRCNYLMRMVEIVVKMGEEAANPVPPGLIRPSAGDYFELCLADIRLNARQKNITQSSIMDRRPDSSVCGYITQMIDHLDTSIFFAQFEAFYKEFVEKADGSYGQFVDAIEKYLKELIASGDSQLSAIIKMMKDYEAASEQQFLEWFNSIKETLESAVNGDTLAEIQRLLKDLYNMANQKDIDMIINDSYVDVEDTGGIFEVATTRDIDDIIGGEYVEDSSGDGLLPVTGMDEIVEKAFQEV